MSTHGGDPRRRDSVYPTGERRPMPPSVPVRNRAPSPQEPPERPSSRGASPSRGPAPGPVHAGTRRAPAQRKRHRFRKVLVALLLLALAGMLLAWLWAESRLTHVDALSGAADTPGDTYLIVGSDSREGWKDDGTEGARTDTIMVLHKPVTGPTALISLPRDSYVPIPGHSDNKINAAYALGGAPLLVETVESVTGLTVDHYLEVGFAGVTDVVDAVGGVELCLDYDVDDRRSKLQWEAGCHLADGDTALAFARMRYADPIGDIGRTERQQQVVSAVAEEAFDTSTLLNPPKAFALADAGLSSVVVSRGTGTIDLVMAARVFNSTRGDQAVTGTPPLVSIGYDVAGVGSTVLLDADAAPGFWERIATGGFPPGTEVGGVN